MRISLTFDIDWAPDFAVKNVLEVLQAFDARATFFATHSSPMLEHIVELGHELGIHPNFLSNSSHGQTTSEVLEAMALVVAQPKFVRTHGLFQSTRLLRDMFTFFPTLQCDLSTLTYRTKDCEPFWLYFPNSPDAIRRMNYNWEDDVALADPAFSIASFHLPGRNNILNFHPMLVDLNAANLTSYQRLKQSIDVSLSYVSEDLVASFRNDGPGVRDLLINVLSGSCPIVELDELF